MKLYLYITNADDFLSGDYHFYADSANDRDIPGWFLAGEAEVDINVDSKELIQHAIGCIDRDGFLAIPHLDKHNREEV